MSLNQSPKIITDGLVFYYDMSNTQKSWKGRPVTNLVDPSWSSWSIDGSGQGSIGTRTIDASYECTIVDNNANTRQNIYISSGITAGTTYTFSVQYKKNYGTPTLRFQIQAYNGSTYLSTISFPTTAQLGILDIDGWQTAKITVTTPASTNRILWFMQDGDDYVAYSHSFSLKNVQCEQNSFATPFVDGTRSTSTAVLDLTSRRTVTLGGSPTYNSDGSFTFNSSGSTTLNLGSGANFLPMPSLTLEAWIKTPGLGSGMSVNGIWGFTYGIRFNAASNGSVYFIIGTDTTTFVNVSTSGVNVNDNNWHHVVAVKNGDVSCAIYVDGILRGSNVPVAGWSGTNPWFAMDIQVGRDQNDAPYYFNGKIDVGRVYNRGLTATEVQQNFNAQKSRYTGYQTITYTATANMTLTNNGTQDVTMFKTSDNNVWNGEVRSTESFSAPCTIEFSKQSGTSDNGASYVMLGWNEDPTSNTSYTSIDHASYPYQQNGYIVYNNGTPINEGKVWDVNRRLYIVYDTDGFVRHYNGSTLIYSANYGANKIVFFDSSFYSVNSTFGGITAVKIARASWNGTNYV